MTGEMGIYHEMGLCHWSVIFTFSLKYYDYM